MKRAMSSSARRLAWPGRALLLGLLGLSACSSFDPQRSIESQNQALSAFTQGRLQLRPLSVRPDSARPDSTLPDREASEVNTLLARPLSQEDAVRVALHNSAALQTLLARHWAEGAALMQGGRAPSPVLAFERTRIGGELEVARLFAFGLLDLLTLPTRRAIAAERLDQAQVQLGAEVVEQLTRVRQAWVRAVAAAQSFQYARQVQEAASASAELARRMAAVGNFNKLQWARQQVFLADAASQAALAQHRALAAREDLVRLLGLDEAQATRLQLPDRLPPLPAAPISPERAGAAASGTRLDVRIAEAALVVQLRAQGLTRITSLTDIELGLRHDSVSDSTTGSAATRRGFEVAVRLPVFDSGQLQRDLMSASTLAASRQLETTMRAAGSQLREAYSAYRTAWDLSRHYRDEVVPLRQQISEENLLRYNGMLIGVFELLADSREQIAAVIAAIQAQQQFWLADAALQASIVGRPMSLPLQASGRAPAPGAAH